MVHLFTEDGNHQTFKRCVSAERYGPSEPEVEVLYVYPDGWVGYLSVPRIFRVIPQHNVKEIHFTREAGKPWTC